MQKRTNPFKMPSEDYFIYTTLLSTGQEIANKIASKTALPRATVYYRLNQMCRNGIVSFSNSDGKKYYKAVEPNAMLSKAEEEINEQLKQMRKTVLDLSKTRKIQEDNAWIETFTGKEGLKITLEQMLEQKPSEFLMYGSSGVLTYKLIPAYIKHWHEKRQKLKIPIRIIYNDTQETQISLKKAPKMGLISIRLSNIKEISNTVTIISRDAIAIMIFETATPIIITINNKALSKAYQENFEILWKNAKHTVYSPPK
ncbi:MAG: hypothetical protein NTY48_00105 [Candidatus Diapherotrites archaeon]|nr:hypothetical protein [Candidatus Diapherotrites archaeon]